MSKDGSDDVTKIRQYAEMAAARSPDVQIHLYARWPRITSDGKGLKFDRNDYNPTKPGSGADLSKVDSFERIWLTRHTGGWDTSNKSLSMSRVSAEPAASPTPNLRKQGTATQLVVNGQPFGEAVQAVSSPAGWIVKLREPATTWWRLEVER